MVRLINSSSNGATEVPGTSADALFVFLAGPIRHWWGKGPTGWPRWYTLKHWRYTRWRNRVHKRLSDDFLVFAPHRAWRGPWNEVAQTINDQAVAVSHVLVYLDVPGIVAVGTAQEAALAYSLAVPVLRFAPGDSLDDLVRAVESCNLLLADS